MAIDPLSHDRYGAGGQRREERHDGPVLAVALAVWYGEHHSGSGYADFDPNDELWEHGGDGRWRPVAPDDFDPPYGYRP